MGRLVDMGGRCGKPHDQLRLRESICPAESGSSHPATLGSYTSHQSRTTGLYQKWIDFFQEQTETYRWDTLSIDPITSYRGRRINAANPANPYSTTSYGDWKTDILDVYNYAGTDCSGYMGWVLYNAINTESGREGFTHFALRSPTIWHTEPME